MEHRNTHVPKSPNLYCYDNSPDITVSYNGISDKAIGRNIIGLSQCAANNAEFAQPVQKPKKSVQQLPKKILNIEDCVSPAKQSPISPMITSASDMKNINVTKPRAKRQVGKEDFKYVHRNESPSSCHYQYVQSPGRRIVGESPIHRHAGNITTNGVGSLKPIIVDAERRGLHANRGNSGSQHVTRDPAHYGQDQSPLAHHYQGRLGNKLEGTSPARERRILAEGGTFAPSTPGRSKLRGTNIRLDETPDKSAPLPKFGEWNEKDPTSADDFTHIFNKRREEKLTAVSMVPAMPPGTPSQMGNHKQANVSHHRLSVWCCMAPRTFE